MGDSTPGDLMYIYCDSYFIALKSTFFKVQREGEREKRERMRSKRGCARSAPNLSSAARLLSNCVVLLFICTEYIQFTFAFGVITTFLTCVVHPLKNKRAVKKTRTPVSSGVSAVSVAGRHYRLSLVEVSKTIQVSSFLKPSSSHFTICEFVDPIQIKIFFKSLNQLSSTTTCSTQQPIAVAHNDSCSQQDTAMAVMIRNLFSAAEESHSLRWSPPIFRPQHRHFLTTTLSKA